MKDLLVAMMMLWVYFFSDGIESATPFLYYGISIAKRMGKSFG